MNFKIYNEKEVSLDRTLYNYIKSKLHKLNIGIHTLKMDL